MKGLRTGLLFITLALLGFFIGGTIVAYTIERPSGLAGAGTAAFSALLGAVIGLACAVYTIRNATTVQIVRINIVSFLLIIVLIVMLQVKKASAHSAGRNSPSLPEIHQADAPVIRSLGVASPRFEAFPVLYFYHPNLDKAVDEHTPVDSLVFERTELGYQINYAPPWYSPEYIKLDYDLLLHKVITVARDWIELEVNRSTGQTAWVDAYSVFLTYWPQFLLRVNSVAPLDATTNPVRVKPLDHAAEVTTVYSALTPVMVQGEWIKVQLLDDDYQKVAEGWIRWAKEGKWQIRFALLS